jgi:hypothetical protein
MEVPMSRDLSEFKSKLTKQGYNLCLPLGASLPTALKAFGFVPGQDVVVRFRYDRLEILPSSSPELLRDKLLSHVDDVRLLKERMQAYMKELPEVSDEELEEEETLEAELMGLLECLVADDLDPAIEKLESVARFGPPAASSKGSPKRKRNGPA